eukprot:EG_transcript_20850
MGQRFVRPADNPVPPPPDEPNAAAASAPAEKKGLWLAFVGACLLGLAGIMELEHRCGDGATGLLGDPYASGTASRPQLLLDALQAQVAKAAQLVQQPITALMQVLGSRVVTGFGCYAVGRWLFRDPPACQGEAPATYAPTPASLHSAACAICLTNAKDTVLFPCRHFCMCWECSRNLQQRCPICRRMVESRFFLYNA